MAVAFVFTRIAEPGSCTTFDCARLRLTAGLAALIVGVELAVAATRRF